MKPKASVYYKEELAGEITQNEDGDFLFIYHKDYIGSESPALSFSLPKRPEPYQSRLVLGFFDGLLPEGWLLKLAGEIYKLNPVADRYELLLKTSYDPVGAVSIRSLEKEEVKKKNSEALETALNSVKPVSNTYKKCFYCYESLKHGFYHESCLKKITDQKEIPVINLSKAILEEIEKINLKNKVSVQGVQHKISLDQFGKDKDSRLTVSRFAGQYILKPKATVPHIPENEHLILMMAKKFGLKVAESALVMLENNDLALLSKRFDRNKKEKIHVEDFGQILDQVVAKKYISSLEKVGKALKSYCFASAPKDQLLRLFELVVFSYVVGNSDLHLKNISVWHNPDPQLAPAYDLLSFEIYQEDFAERDPEESALAINGKKSKLDKNDFDTLALSYGLSDKVRDYVYKNINSKIPEFEDLIDKSFLPERKRKAIKELILKRSSALKSSS